MAFCSKCGSQVEDGGKFCKVCGNPIAQAAAAAAPQQAAPQQAAPNYQQAAPNYQQAAPNFQQAAPNQQPNGANNNFTDQFINTKDHTAEFDPADIQKNKGLCAISYLGVLFFLPLVACPESKYGKFHANQALLALFVDIACSIVGGILNAIIWAVFADRAFGVVYGLNPFGSVLSIIFGIVFWAVPLAFALFGIINTAQGKSKELPLIGKISIIK